MPMRPEPDRQPVDRLRHLGEQGPGILLHSVVARPEDVFNDKIGLRKVLDAQAAGFQKLVDAADGNAQAAIGLLLVDKIPELAKTQADAIKNIKFDKITVFDGGDGQGTAGFLSNMFKSIPALSEFMNQSGLNLPEYLARNGNENVNPEPVKNGHPEAPVKEESKGGKKG